ncbi:unnamed protein product [Adineta ricciae]|uniref:NTR domain-containing protein n=1 Tax=Adineta ricciae TaxID=249248 RepID=A0A816AIA7_ADIRI|nr:unnamed protein product [Adineta ricciae]CAF1596564.1 unnamed protein product [Adineta ricciae]
MTPRYTVFFIILFSSGCIELINSCSCASDITLEKSFAAATHVFTGKAIRTKPGSTKDDYQITFEVDKLFKGSVPPNGHIIVSTPYESAACGVPISAGQNWQVWTTGTDGSLKVLACGRSTSETTRDMNFLNQHYIPRSAANLHSSSTYRCQYSLIITIVSSFVFLEYRLFSFNR